MQWINPFTFAFLTGIKPAETRRARGNYSRKEKQACNCWCLKFSEELYGIDFLDIVEVIPLVKAPAYCARAGICCRNLQEPRLDCTIYRTFQFCLAMQNRNKCSAQG
jgi:hypothetical protein